LDSEPRAPSRGSKRELGLRPWRREIFGVFVDDPSHLTFGDFEKSDVPGTEANGVG